MRVAPTVTVQLLRKGSVFDALITSRADDGVNERSARQRERELSNEWAVGAQNSLARRKPKKAVQKAAQSIRLSWVVVECESCSACLRSRRSCRVMGRRGLVEVD